ncbi:MAG: hypothetical protein IKC03_03890 [Oscillospiraceae bacterium]|nr:hypothetical protein [Oscillospiraceae bacterium]
MYGRNGSDQLNMALLVCYIIFCLLGSILVRITHSSLLGTVLNLLMNAMLIVLWWRLLSKNLTKRRAENAKFLSWWSPRRARLRGAIQRRQDKSHKYFTCRSCKTICRVPIGKGKIEITCPKCGNKIRAKS